MSQPLVPCPACHRHVRISESACPFCASALPADFARGVIPGTTQRLSRSAAFAFASTLTIAGCSSTGQTATTGDAAQDTATSEAGGADAGHNDADTGIVALYGGAPDAITPIDTGANDADTGMIAIYGGPPDGALDVSPGDSMSDGPADGDTGGGGAIYGSAPKPPSGGHAS
ncbi:MAG: hypothetical protein ACHREM_14980 [Polyangiales bacterium]